MELVRETGGVTVKRYTARLCTYKGRATPEKWEKQVEKRKKQNMLKSAHRGTYLSKTKTAVI